jgi:hypothetical protein
MTRADCQAVVEAMAPPGVPRSWIVEETETLWILADSLPIEAGHEIDLQWLQDNKKDLFLIALSDLAELQKRSQS